MGFGYGVVLVHLLHGLLYLKGPVPCFDHVRSVGISIPVVMFVRQICVALAIAALTGAAPSTVKHVLHEKRDKRAYDWVKGDRVHSDAVLPVRIGLSQNNLEKGYDYLMEV